jgi:hypothetical protein
VTTRELPAKQAALAASFLRAKRALENSVTETVQPKNMREDAAHPMCATKLNGSTTKPKAHGG